MWVEKKYQTIICTKNSKKKCKQSDMQKELEFQISKDASMNCKLLKNVLNDKK